MGVTFSLRVLRGRLVLDVEGQPPAIIGRVEKVRGIPCVITPSGVAAPLDPKEVKGVPR